jgi:NAD(P)-dependent dehydrogenase (short-subunit alcohol dehydrogenase family)
MTDLTGKVALVTGAASGIGAATARRFVADGARVALADVNLEGAEAVAAELGDAAQAVLLDAADADSVRAAVDATVDAFGGLDVLHNNAAATSVEVLSQDTNVVDIDLGVWDHVMAVNVRGYVAGCKYAIPIMAARGGGSIICTSSGNAYGGDLVRIAYGCSKGAVNTLVKYVATQHAHQGIRCNAIAPGLVLTPAVEANVPEMAAVVRRHILTDHVRVEDIAALAAFLASDESRPITGGVLNCDAGLYSHQPTYADFASMAQAAG